MIQITQTNGEVTITGNERDLRYLAAWVLEAAVLGQAHPAFVHKDGVAQWHIIREFNGRI